MYYYLNEANLSVIYDNTDGVIEKGKPFTGQFSKMGLQKRIPMKFRDPPHWALNIVLTAVYFIAAKLGLSMASLHINVSPVWPPTGIAIAAVLMLGYKVWPGILLGAFLINLSTGVSVATSSGIAIGNTLEAVLATFLLHRFIGRKNFLDRAQDVFKFWLFAATLSTLASATVGTLSLCLGGAANWSSYGSLWLTWWLGDGVGALVVAPVFLTWGMTSYQQWLSGRFSEALLWLLLLSIVALIVFGGWFPTGVTNYPLEYLTIPFLVWAALRFGQYGVTVGIVLLSGIAIWGTLQGIGPFIRETPNESLLLLQLFIGTVTITALVLAAVVTERKIVEEERAQLLEREQEARMQAEAANRIKDQFLATVSHELRTPLTSVLGWSKLLLDGDLDNTTATKAVETIERNAKAQAQLIEDLLDISRIVSGKLSLDIQIVNLKQVTEAGVEVVRLAAEAKNIQLHMVFVPGKIPVLGDPTRLQQVVWNLLSNAVKFTPKEGRVEVRLERVNSQIQIIVSDTGMGIPKTFLPYIFDHFTQADSSTTRKYGGLGLGLAIVRHIVELHGGLVQAESLGEGQGSTFTVTLPAVLLPLQEDFPAKKIENKII
jgi:signal transduction histidine kinase